MCLVFLTLRVPSSGGELRMWVMDEVEDFTQAALEGTQVHFDSLVILEALDEDENLAFGRMVVDEFGKETPLSDGSIALVRSEWVSGTPVVFGRHFTVDLGLDRAMTRVRVLAGETALTQLEYYMRGYRLETATQSKPNIWHLLAEERSNFVLNVDTRKDSTWSALDQRGEAVARVGRYVRLTLIRQDRTNWVSLGEIEVYGVGYVSEGSIVAEFAGPEPVNVGRMRWQIESPPRTQVQMQLRGGDIDQLLPDWEELGIYQEQDLLFAGREPVVRLQYRGLLKTTASFTTPALRNLEIDYDPVLVADKVSARVAPDTARKGVVTELTYTAEIEMLPGDYGIDLMRLKGISLAIDELRVGSRSLVYDETLARGFRYSGQEETFIELAPQERIAASETVEIKGQAPFLQNRTSVELAVGNREQGDRDGYVNWQNAREAPGASWTVRAFGAPLDLLSKIEVSPSPFSPFRDETVGFRFVVSNIQEDTEIVLDIFTLDGQQVRQLVQTGRARVFRFAWDGRDQDNRIATPGLYLYQVQVKGSSGASGRGTFVVAY